MPDSDDKPLDLSSFDLDQPAVAAPNPSTNLKATDGAPIPESLAPVERLPRLVDIDKLKPEDLAAAEAMADKLNLSSSASIMAYGDGVMNGLAAASRQLLSGVRLKEAGEAGQIAAAVLDGIKILRISDLQTEASAGPKRQGFMGKLLGGIGSAKTAIEGFAEGRKKFLTLMDQQTAKARAISADLSVSIQLLEQQDTEIRTSLSNLRVAIAAGQIALDRAADTLEAKRLYAISTGDAADAADVQAYRSAIANFRSKVGDMREALVGSAALIPIIAQNRAAAETRKIKISNGILVVIPRLMAVASQAVVQVEIRKAAESAARLDEANRQITLLAAQGAHDAATSAARALGGDQRNLEALAQAAEQTIVTMNEVIEIERGLADTEREREQELIKIRDKLVVGMQGVNQKVLEK